MSRLTERAKNGIAYLANVKPDEQEVNSLHQNTLRCILDGISRLADYEDAEQSGALVWLPCNVGDVVYDIEGASYEVYTVQASSRDTATKFAARFYATPAQQNDELDDIDFWDSDIGETIYLTREAAEATKRGE